MSPQGVTAEITARGHSRDHSRDRVRAAAMWLQGGSWWGQNGGT